MNEECVKMTIKALQNEIYKIDDTLKNKSIAQDGKEDDKHITSSKFLQLIIQKARMQAYQKALADILCGKFDNMGGVENAIKSAKQTV